MSYTENGETTSVVLIKVIQKLWFPQNFNKFDSSWMLFDVDNGYSYIGRVF